MNTEHTAITEPVRRIEVFTGAGRRRTWRAEEKARIVAESMASETSVCAVARRHGLSPQQLFAWRRDAREAAVSDSQANSVGLFIPAVVAQRAASASENTPARGHVRRSASPGATATIELEIGGVTVRVGRDAQAETIAAVIRALKAGA